MTQQLPTRTIHDMLRNNDQRVFIYEVLRAVALMDNDEEKIATLRKYASKGPEYTRVIRSVVECLFHPEVSFDLPAGKPDYTPYPDASDASMAPANLFNEVKKLHYFLNGSNTRIEDDAKRQRVFVQMLESLYRKEAELLVMLKDRKLDGRVYPKMNEALFRKTFPEWMGDNSKNA